MPLKKEQHILIVAGEASGDIHGAKLVKAIREINPDITFSGMGGQDMAAAGVEILFEASKIAVVGAIEVLSHLKDIWRARQTLVQHMQEKKPDLVILIDFPDFNMLLAAKAKKIKLPVFYYISPQVWAWRKKRVKKITNLADRVATILPFESDFYAQHGYAVDFVGHPLLDTVKPSCPKKVFLKKYNLPEYNQFIAIIPGSRSKEISFLLPTFLEAAKIFNRSTNTPCTFLLPLASTVSKDLLNENGLLAAKEEIDIRVIPSDRYDLMASCDAAIAASGTVTLELGILETPVIVAYRLSPLTYKLGKLLIRGVKYFCLINLVSKKQVVPELLQDEASPIRIVSELKKILEKDNHEKIVSELQTLKKLLGGTGASTKAATIALEIINEH